VLQRPVGREKVLYIILVLGCLFESLQPVEDKFIAYTNTACCQVTVVSGPWKRDGCKTFLVVFQPCGFLSGFPLHPTNTFPELFPLHPPIQIVVVHRSRHVASSLRNSFAFGRSAFDEHELRRSSVRSQNMASCIWCPKASIHVSLAP